MRRFWGFLASATAALLAGMALTLGTGLGFPLAHYDAGFALLLGGAAASWRFLARRRIATTLLAYTGLVATVTGFAMLYTRQFPYKEWLTWWHSVTSFAFLLAFLAHWFLNHARLMRFTRSLARRLAAGAPLAGAWVAILAGLVWTASPAGRALFHAGNYIRLATWAVFLGTGFAYGLWLTFRHPALQARLARAPVRDAARGAIDTSLFLMCWGSLLTGFLLLYFNDPLVGAGFKYVSKWWHSATSVGLLALLALHIGFNARFMRAHARRLDAELAAPRKVPEGPVAPREG